MMRLIPPSLRNRSAESQFKFDDAGPRILAAGHMFTKRIGIYGEFLSEIDSNAYDWGVGIGVRIMY